MCVDVPFYCIHFLNAMMFTHGLNLAFTPFDYHKQTRTSPGYRLYVLMFAFKYSTVIPGAALPPSPPSEGKCNNCIHWWIEVTACLWFNVERFLHSGWLFQLLHWRSLSRSTYELLLWCKLPPIWRLLQWCTQWLSFCRYVADIYNLPNMFTWKCKEMCK